MGDFNLDLSEVEKANEVAVENTACTTSDSEEKGNNVVFYIIMGVLCLSGIGVPVLVFLLLKERKKRKQAEEQLNKPAEEAKPSEKTEEKSEEKKESQEEKKEEKTPEK